jgi:hypothetical protein
MLILAGADVNQVIYVERAKKINSIAPVVANKERIHALSFLY